MVGEVRPHPAVAGARAGREPWGAVPWAVPRRGAQAPCWHVVLVQLVLLCGCKVLKRR